MTDAEKAAVVLGALDPRRECQRCGELTESYHTQAVQIRCERDEFYKCACGLRWWETYNTLTGVVISTGGYD